MNTRVHNLNWSHIRRWLSVEVLGLCIFLSFLNVCNCSDLLIKGKFYVIILLAYPNAIVICESPYFRGFEGFCDYA